MTHAYSDEVPESLRRLSFESLVQGCVPLSHDLIDGLEELLAGVEYDPAETLPDGFVPPWEPD